MKKIYSLALVLALLLSLSTPALAEENSTNLRDLGSSDISVNAVYEAGIEGGTVYSVDIAWENMSFAYKGESEDTWDPVEHKYNKTSAEAHWLESDAKITVTNHSNAFLTLECDYTAEEGFEDTEMQFAYSSYDCDSPNTGLVYSAEIGNNAQTTTITVTPGGTLPETTTVGTPIGNITLTIAQWAPTVEEAEEFADTATTKLSDAETQTDNDLYISAQSAVAHLSDAAAAVSSSGTNEDRLNMIIAYLDAHSAMADFEAQLDQTT